MLTRLRLPDLVALMCHAVCNLGQSTCATGPVHTGTLTLAELKNKTSLLLVLLVNTS
jgi:hypothetical protein